jgi:hypothetical protein
LVIKVIEMPSQEQPPAQTVQNGHQHGGDKAAEGTGSNRDRDLRSLVDNLLDLAQDM